MIYVENTTKAVRVLKSPKQPPLRLMPGHNRVKDKTTLGAYLEGNKAANAMFDEEVLKIGSDLDPEETKAAILAEEKNSELNKSYRIIKATNDKLMASNQRSDDQAGVLREQSDTISAQAELLAEQGELLTKIQEQMAELQADNEEED